jgi:myo-inositol-1(or 4)-monophosphatase
VSGRARVSALAVRDDDLARIRGALVRAAEVLARFSASKVGISYKGTHSPVTDADVAVDETLRRELPRADEGWLSEESVDDRARLERRRVWIVDPLDGTREFLDGVPQWSVSIGLAEDGEAVAGGVYNPSTEELFLAARETGATLNGMPIAVSRRDRVDGAVVLANRWALRRRPGEFTDQPFRVQVVNALAYSLALIAAGRADAMWSRSPKAEWDTAAGTALIVAAGGRVTTHDGGKLRFNAWPPRAPGIVATNGRLHGPVQRWLAHLPRGRR